MSEDEMMILIRQLDARLSALESLPNSIDRLTYAIDAQTKAFSNAVPMKIFAWTFAIVALLIGSVSALKVITSLFGVQI